MSHSRHLPPFEKLGLPPVLMELITRKRGLMLFVEASRLGKSTTIALMLKHPNKTHNGHILTLEDPIEFLFKSSIVNQRELGTDTDNLDIALKNALRQALDCIFIGEIRDRGTMKAALTYAQSGHLVVPPLHANNSCRALNRVISFFPLENWPMLLEDFASILTAIVSQRLISTTPDKRTPAFEIMLNTHHISELMEEGKISHIKETIEKSLAPDSQASGQALMKMIETGVITQEEALSQADSPINLYWLFNNEAPMTEKMILYRRQRKAEVQPSRSSHVIYNLE